MHLMEYRRFFIIFPGQSRALFDSGPGCLSCLCADTVPSFVAAVLPVADTDHSKSTMCTRDMSLDSLHSSMDSLATHDAPSTSAQVSALSDAEQCLIIVPILCWCRNFSSFQRMHPCLSVLCPRISVIVRCCAKCLDRPQQAVQQTQQASVRTRQTQCKHMQGGHSGGGIKSWDHPSQRGRESSQTEVSRAILIQVSPLQPPSPKAAQPTPGDSWGNIKP